MVFFAQDSNLLEKVPKHFLQLIHSYFVDFTDVTVVGEPDFLSVKLVAKLTTSFLCSLKSSENRHQISVESNFHTSD